MLVLTVRTAHLQSHAGQVAFPGGGSEPADGDAVATALRESEEEIGLDPALVTPLGFLDRFETISGFCVTPVVARIAAHAQLYPSPDEVAEVFEVPLAFFLEPAQPASLHDGLSRPPAADGGVRPRRPPHLGCHRGDAAEPAAEDGTRMTLKTTLIDASRAGRTGRRTTC